MNGATDEDIAETAMLTRFTTGWSSILHVADIDLAEFKKQFTDFEDYVKKQAK